MSRFALLAALLSGCHKPAPEPTSEPASQTGSEAQTLDEAIAASSADVADEEASTGAARVASGQRTRPEAEAEAAPTPEAATPDAGEPEPTEPTAGQPQTATPVETTTPAASEGTSEERGPPPGLEILANNRWRVPRKLADRWEEHYRRIGRFKQVDDGWRIRVRYQSPGWYLGMRTGDVVLSVNGMKLNNKAQLLAAYVKLKKKTDFEVLIRRGGGTVTHRYTIVD